MNKMSGFLVTILISCLLVFASVSDAQAKRFGSSRSFGGKSSYSSPFRRANTSKVAPSRSASQQKAYKQNQTARQRMSRRGGIMGMLGGLALGGLIGSMFFGGAFENINFMDILIFAGIAYLLYKIFAAKANKNQRRTQPVYTRDSYGSQQDHSQYKPQSSLHNSQQRVADFDTDILFNKGNNQKRSTKASFSAEQNDATFEQDIIPVDFDEAGFLAGAIAAFKNLQDAWDKRELAEIRGLTTDKVFAEIQQQLQASSEVNQTDVLKVDAELLSIREIGPDLEAAVLFDSIIREDNNAQAEQVREVWHFIKPKNSVQPKWYLDGIQQLEQ